jgi:thiamine-phosphate pyrophosphorylase
MIDGVEAARLHLVTSPHAREGYALLEVVRSAVDAGVACVQVRDKSCSGRELYELVLAVIGVCRPRGSLVVVNDRLDVALAAGADGVHLGVDDLDWAAARSISPPGFIIGCTAATIDRVRVARSAEASYVGAGPACATTTKIDTGPRLTGEDYARLARACGSAESGRTPLVAIGGIGPGSAAGPIEAGADAIAVSRAIMESEDPAATTRALLDEVDGAIARRGENG